MMMCASFPYLQARNYGKRTNGITGWRSKLCFSKFSELMCGNSPQNPGEQIFGYLAALLSPLLRRRQDGKIHVFAGLSPPAPLKNWFAGCVRKNQTLRRKVLVAAFPGRLTSTNDRGRNVQQRLTALVSRSDHTIALVGV
jgi:hypothetical protein